MSIALKRHRRSSIANRVHIGVNPKGFDSRQVTYDPHTGTYREPANPTLSAIAFLTLLATERCTQALDPRAMAKHEVQPDADIVA
jgi:hypothetical protein